MKAEIELDWKYVGALIANSDSNVQIDFFKSFVAELEMWTTAYMVGVQLEQIRHSLTEREREILKGITS